MAYHVFGSNRVMGVEYFFKISEQVVNVPADVHFPVVEMPTRSRLNCLSWNAQIKNQIASSDYEGIVTVWDVNTRQVCDSRNP